ncbi:serine/threonine-protein kinase [Plesiocystis pacifica]|nr:serine/threonine-protein kinase [Plesiocystis pacifica]
MEPEAGADLGETLAASEGGDELGETLMGSAPERARGSGGGALDRAAREPRRGDVFGRYVVLGRLGAGAMGVVLAAYDPELDRKVAIKLLKMSGGGSLAARERLQREAQALARLDHPNVVGVHDVGEHGGQPFVAMEFVAGQTLDEWLKAGQGARPWREVLLVFRAAGAGLRAAHEAALVHRDFKPENVMLGDDGRVRVMDFGISRVEVGEGEARADAEAGAEAGVDPGVDPGAARRGAEWTRSQLDGERLTRTGALMGTPAYMPPEQFAGQPADARSDQFSFCVALYEGLYGELPFAGETLGELVLAVTEGAVREAPARRSAPPWLRRVVVRGLAKDPDARWPSMAALLEALADDPVPRRRRRWAAAGALALVVGAVWGGARLVEPDPPRCQAHEAEEIVAEVWSADARASLETSFAATQLSYAEDTAARVGARLDAYAASWAAARTEACLAGERGEQSPALVDRRMICLDRGRAHLRGLVGELARADADTVERAVEAALELPRLERCADAEALMAELAPPEDPAVAARVRELDERLAAAKARADAGKWRESQAMVEAVLADAEPLDYAPLLVRARLQRADWLTNQGEYEAADAALEALTHEALALKMMPEAASAANSRLFVVGYALAKAEEGARLRPLALALTEAAEADGDRRARSQHLNAAGVMLASSGEVEAGRPLLEQALAQREAEVPVNRLAVAVSLNNLGGVVKFAGELERAGAYYGRALDIKRELLGDGHPKVASTLYNLGFVAYDLGELDEARAHYEEARQIWTAANGSDFVDVGLCWNNLGLVAKDEGKLEEARASFEEARRIWTEAVGPEHPDVASAINNLGLVALLEGRIEDAQIEFQEARRIWAAAYGEDSLDVARTDYNLGEVAAARGDYAEAEALFGRALATRERELGPGHTEVSDTLVGLALAVQGRGEAEAEGREARFGRAQALIERGLALRVAAFGPEHVTVANVHFDLCSILLGQAGSAGSEQRRALAERAAAACGTARTLWQRARGPEDASVARAEEGIERAEALLAELE